MCPRRLHSYRTSIPFALSWRDPQVGHQLLFPSVPLSPSLYWFSLPYTQRAVATRASPRESFPREGSAMYAVKSPEERMSPSDTAATRSFFVRYLGCNAYRSRSKPNGIKSLQGPLLELYSTARRKGEDHRSVHPLALTQRLDVSHYGLVVAEEMDDPKTGDALTVVTRVITPASSIVLWAALRFNSRLAKRKSIGAAFVPIACCSDDVVDRSWYVRLATKRRFLVGLAHPPLFACLLRRVAAPKTWECHAFLCASAEDALLVCSTLGEARNSVVVVDRPLLGYPIRHLDVESSADFSDGALTSTSSFHRKSFLLSNGSSPAVRDVPTGRCYQNIENGRTVQKGRLFAKRQATARTDTESKSSTSDERHRRVRRKAYVHKNQARKYRSSLDTPERRPDSGTKTVDSYHYTDAHKAPKPRETGKYFKPDSWLVNSSIQTDETKSWDSSVERTQTNDTGYYSTKSKSLNLIEDEGITRNIYVKQPDITKISTTKQSYYFGDSLKRPVSTSYKEKSTNTESVTGTKSYTYFLEDEKLNREPFPLRKATPDFWKSESGFVTKADTRVSPDSSVSGYHSHTCSPTRDTGTMTDHMHCSSDLDSCSCDLTSVCSECSPCCRRKVRRYPDQMELSETMDLSSESEHASVKQWKRPLEPVICTTYSYVGGKRTPNDGSKLRSESREILTQAEVHQHYQGANTNSGRDSSRRDTSPSNKISPSSMSTIRGNGTNKVIIDVQYPPKTNSLTTGVIGFNKHGHVRDWASLSRSSEISQATGPATLPMTRSPRQQKMIRWSSMERSPGFFSSLKKLSISSFTKAKRKTGKLFSNFRNRMSHKKSSASSEDSAYDTSEVCLSPDGSQKPKPKKKRRRLSWSFHDLRVAFPSMKTTTNSKEVIYVNNHRAGHRRHRQRRTRYGSSETSDSGVEEYHSDYSSTYNSHRKTDSELEQFATEVSRVNVNHGMNKDTFRRWSQTNLHGELGYIP